MIMAADAKRRSSSRSGMSSSSTSSVIRSSRLTNSTGAEELNQIVRLAQFAKLEATDSSLGCRPATAWRWSFTQPGSAGALRARDRRALKEHPGSAAADGNSQRTGERGDRRERAHQYRRRRHQHGAAGDGLRRRRPHSCFPSTWLKILKNTSSGDRSCTTSAIAK